MDYIIRKLSNGTEIEFSSDNKETYRGDYDIRMKKGIVDVFNYTHKPIHLSLNDVEKVIDVNGNETIITSLDQLYTELSNGYFI